jgi:L-threonylcarbamoyladenylate synthase
VLFDMQGRIAGILDGGAAAVGVESTIVDCTGDVAVILRPGAITPEDISAVLGSVDYDASLRDPSAQPRAPGMKYRHYAPDAQLVVVDGDSEFFRAQVQSHLDAGHRVSE